MPELNAADPLERFYAGDHPELGTGPVPTEPYVSQSYFEQEREKVFSQSWLLACHESEIPKPGDFVVKDAAIFRASIIIVRGRDGVVRAFHNVCRHRGNKLVCASGQGHAEAFFCKFHGWTFALDGRLRGVPEQDRFPGFDKSGHMLKPFSMQMWKGFVFLHPQVSPRQSLREYLGTLANPLEAFPFERMRLMASYSGTLRSNWKVAINAFQEAYHVPTVHAVSARTLFVSRLCDFRFHGPHRAMTLPLSPDFKPKPVEILSSRFTTGMSQDAVGRNGTVGFPGTNPRGTPNFSFDINIVFPSSFIDVGEGYYFTYEFWPVRVDEVHFVMKLYTLPARKWSQRIGQELSRIFLREGISEDLSTLESTQQGLSSGALPDMVLSDQEIAIRHQYQVIEDMLRG